MAAARSGYDELLAQNAALTQDLSTAVNIHERLRSDHQALKELYEAVKSEHTRLKEQYTAARQDSARHESSKRQLEADFDSQRRLWKQKLDVKIAEFEELQQQVSPPRDLDMLRLKITEEVEGPFRAQVRQLEAKMAEDAKRTTEAKRHAEVLKIELAQLRKEHQDKVGELEAARRSAEDQWARKVATLKEQLEAKTSSAAEVVQLRGQLAEQVQKARVSQQSLVSARQAHEADLAKHIDELNARVKENGDLKQLVRTLEADVQKKQRESDTLQSENSRFDRELRAMREKTAEVERRTAEDASRSAERNASQVASLEESLSRERKALLAAKDQLAAATRQLEERTLDDEAARAALLEEHAEEKRRLETEMQAQEELQRARQRGDVAAKERAETALQQAQSDARAAAAAADAKEAQLLSKIGMMEDLKAQLEARVDAQEQEAKELQDKATEFEVLRKDYSDLQFKHRDLLVETEKHLERANTCDTEKRRLQVEFAELSTSVDKERQDMMSQLEDARQKRGSETTQLAQELQASQGQVRKEQEQLAALQKASKRYMDKARKKLAAYKARCHQLATSARQLEEEKRVAMQICEENRTDYERRLSEYDRSRRELDLLLGTGAVGGSYDVRSAAGAESRSELRGIKDRLAAQAAKYRLEGEGERTEAA